MGGEISLENDDSVELFDEKQFAKKWKSSGLADESMWGFFNSSYADLVESILRPPANKGLPGRCRYTEKELGPVAFTLDGVQYARKDFQITNWKGQMIVCSHWKRTDEVEQPCVIYLHSATGSRVEATQVLPTVLRAGCTLVAFDFAGSGLSDGEHISWGWFEHNDCLDMVKLVRELKGTTAVALWGRTLGAAVALAYASKDRAIAAVVLDTPYSSLDEFIEQGVNYAKKHGVRIPKLILKVAIEVVSKSIKEKISRNFDAKKVAPINHAPMCSCPALFIAGTRDMNVPLTIAQSVMAAYKGQPKSMLLMEGGTHFSLRTADSLQPCGIFLKQVLPIATGTMTAAATATEDGTGENQDRRDIDLPWIKENHFRIERLRSQA